MRLKLIGSLLALVALAGCQGKATAGSKAGESLRGMTASTSAIATRADVVVQQAKTTSATPQREVIVEQALAIKTDAAAIDKQVTVQDTNIQLMAGSIAKLEFEKQAALNQVADWNDDFIGPRAYRWAGGILGAVTTLGLIGVVLRVASPFGMGMAASQGINTLFMLPFKVLGDLLLRRRGLTQAVVPTSALPAVRAGMAMGVGGNEVGGSG